MEKPKEEIGSFGIVRIAGGGSIGGREELDKGLEEVWPCRGVGLHEHEEQGVHDLVAQVCR